MGSENNMVAVDDLLARAEDRVALGKQTGAHTGHRLNIYQIAEELLARLAQPDAQQGEATVADLAAFGASDAACHLYPGEHQQPERAAFCGGAAWLATPQQGASSPASGEGVEVIRHASELLLTLARITKHRTIDPTVPLAKDILATAEHLAALAAATQPAVPQVGRKWVSSGPRSTDDPNDRNLWWVGPGRPVAWVTRDAAQAIIAALTGAGENGEQGA